MKWVRNPYFSLYLLALAAYGLFQGYYGQLETVLLVNRLHFNGADLLFRLLTLLGDGYVVVGFSLLLFFVNRELGILSVLSYLASSAITQVLKRTVFDHLRRPLWHLESMKINDFRLPEGAEMIYNNSFPSGHSTSVFAFFTMLAYFTSNVYLKLLYLFLAILTAFSRIYLVQHFPVDTLVGSLIGVICAALIYHLLYLPGRLNFLFKPKKDV